MEKDYKIFLLENKSPEWKIATLSDDQQQYANVSINKVNKKGEVFPDFDQISNGGVVKGNMWTSPTGKYYLFAPKVGVAGQSGGGFKSGIKEAQATKRKDIETAQENRGQGVRISATMRDAVLISTTLAQGSIQDESVLKGRILEIRQWLWQHWDDPEGYPPF